MSPPQEEVRKHARAMLTAHVDALTLFKKLLREAPEPLWDLVHEVCEAQYREGDHQRALLSILKRQGVL